MHLFLHINCLVLLGCFTVVIATSAKDPPNFDFTVYETYINDSYYKNFPENTLNFRPRMQKSRRHFEELDEITDEMDTNHEEESFTSGRIPSKTIPQKLLPRSTFTFSCPTSIQCSDAGCCPIGTWCSVVDGQVGCCDLPIGKACLAFPSRNCQIQCGDICCDDFDGPDPNGLLSGDVICAPVPGVDIDRDWDDHTPAFQCQFTSTGPAPTPSHCPASAIRCGFDCCPNDGFICNTMIPGIQFCDPTSDPNIAAGVTAVSQLGFNAQSFNTSAGAQPMNITSGNLYTATTAIMNGTAVSISPSSLYKSLTGSETSNTATSTPSVATVSTATVSTAGVMAQAQQTAHGLIAGAVVAFVGFALALGL